MAFNPIAHIDAIYWNKDLRTIACIEDSKEFEKLTVTRGKLETVPLISVAVRHDSIVRKCRKSIMDAVGTSRIAVEDVADHAIEIDAGNQNLTKLRDESKKIYHNLALYLGEDSAKWELFIEMQKKQLSDFLVSDGGQKKKKKNKRKSTVTSTDVAVTDSAPAALSNVATEDKAEEPLNVHEVAKAPRQTKRFKSVVSDHAKGKKSN